MKKPVKFSLCMSSSVDFTLDDHPFPTVEGQVMPLTITPNNLTLCRRSSGYATLNAPKTQLERMGKFPICLILSQTQLINEQMVIFVAATCGQGDPPDNMKVMLCQLGKKTLFLAFITLSQNPLQKMIHRSDQILCYACTLDAKRSHKKSATDQRDKKNVKSFQIFFNCSGSFLLIKIEIITF